MNKPEAAAETADEDLTEESDAEFDADEGGAVEDADAETSDVVRDPATRKITGIRISNTYTDNCLIQRYSMVMVQAEPGKDKFLGYVQSLGGNARTPRVKICWFYRASDLPAAKTSDMLVYQARLSGRSSGGGGKKRSAPVDKGRFKEIFFSNHLDEISVDSIMHPIKVWFLPSGSLDPVTLPPEGGSEGGRVVLLPGFVCRKLYNTHTKDLYPLSEVSSPERREELGEPLVEDVEVLTRLSETERERFKEEWLQGCRERAARAEQLRQAADEEQAAMDTG